MKIKISFVTNSSSTSFIVGRLNENEKLDSLIVTMKIEVDLIDYIRETLKTPEELKEFWKDRYEDDEEKYLQCLKIIKEGGVIYILHAADDGGEVIESILCEKGLKNVESPNNFIIIEGDGGY